MVKGDGLGHRSANMTKTPTRVDGRYLKTYFGRHEGERLGFPVPGAMRAKGWIRPKQAAASAAGAEALAEAEGARAAVNPSRRPHSSRRKPCEAVS